MFRTKELVFQDTSDSTRWKEGYCTELFLNTLFNVLALTVGVVLANYLFANEYLYSNHTFATFVIITSCC